MSLMDMDKKLYALVFKNKYLYFKSKNTNLNKSWRMCIISTSILDNKDHVVRYTILNLKSQKMHFFLDIMSKKFLRYFLSKKYIIYIYFLNLLSERTLRTIHIYKFTFFFFGRKMKKQIFTFMNQINKAKAIGFSGGIKCRHD